MWRALNAACLNRAWPGTLIVRATRDAEPSASTRCSTTQYAGWDDSYIARSHHGLARVHDRARRIRSALWFLVERDGELVALRAALEREPGASGWVKDIVVARCERGRGLATRCSTMRSRLRGAGRRTGRAEGRLDEPDRRAELYERLGFVTDQRYEIWREAAMTTSHDRLSPPLAPPAAARAQPATRTARGRNRERRPGRSPAGSCELMSFYDAQRHHVDSLLDEWERETRRSESINSQLTTRAPVVGLVSVKGSRCIIAWRPRHSLPPGQRRQVAAPRLHRDAPLR